MAKIYSTTLGSPKPRALAITASGVLGLIISANILYTHHSTSDIAFAMTGIIPGLLGATQHRGLYQPSQWIRFCSIAIVVSGIVLGLILRKNSDVFAHSAALVATSFLAMYCLIPLANRIFALTLKNQRKP